MSSFDNPKLTARLQLSRQLFSVACDIEVILCGKSESEREELEKKSMHIFKNGALQFLQRIKDIPDLPDDDREELLSPHAVSYTDALEMGMCVTPPFKSITQAELYASLANVLLDAIPFEIKWVGPREQDLSITDPVELIEATVLATNAVEAIQRANNSYLINDKAKKKAAKAHVENRAMKEQAENWWHENRHQHRSKDGAAEAIAGKVVPVKFRTARKWIDDWEKLRSASAE